MSLDEIRKKINELDADLVPLLKARMECSLEVAKIKQAENLPVYHPQREKELLEKVAIAGEEYGDYIATVYRYMMGVSRALQTDTLFKNSRFGEELLSYPKEMTYKRVICQGAEGSFSHAAAKSFFQSLNLNFY